MLVNSYPAIIDNELEISTLVELYQAIAEGIVNLGVLEKLPDGKRLFCGNKESQFNTQATRERYVLAVGATR